MNTQIHNFALLFIVTYLFCIPSMAVIFVGINIAYYRGKFPIGTPFKKEVRDHIPISILASLIWPIALVQHYFLFDKFKYGLQFRCEHRRIREIERYDVSCLPVGKSNLGEKVYSVSGKCFCQDCGKVILHKYTISQSY